MAARTEPWEIMPEQSAGASPRFTGDPSRRADNQQAKDDTI
jgi:hypothetical protein